MLGVNILPHTPEELKKVKDAHKLNWRNFADDGSIAKRWNSPATPSFYIIDHQGFIRHKWIGHPGEKTIEAALVKLLRQVKPGK
ncbi:MAG: redoxin domain-containing protein [Planctomycetes bacterium]|nr:redoxin domain-containing protein [Planctomycetota bacterium]